MLSKLAYSFLQGVSGGKDLLDKVFSCDYAGGDGIAEGVEFNGLVVLKELLAQEHIEVGVLLI